METTECHECLKEVPVKEEGGERVLRSHALGYREGPCPASGDTVGGSVAVEGEDLLGIGGDEV